MPSSRLPQLLAFLEEDPEDPFVLYALATEYRSEQPLKALSFYEHLLEKHPHYVATYYHAALLYVDREEPEKAEQTFERGIVEAKEQNEALALRELQNAYNNFLFEE